MHLRFPFLMLQATTRYFSVSAEKPKP